MSNARNVEIKMQNSKKEKCDFDETRLAGIRESNNSDDEFKGGKKELNNEIISSNTPTIERLEENRKKISGFSQYFYERCKRECTKTVDEKAIKLPVCSSSGKSYESCCHFDCDKKYVSPHLKAEFIGKCDDPRKYTIIPNNKENTNKCICTFRIFKDGPLEDLANYLREQSDK